MIEPIKYEPSKEDLERVRMIRDFLNDEEIPFIEDEDTFGVFHLNDRTTQLRYVDSYYHRNDMTKRFGEGFEGISHEYFIDISHENFDNGIRTIWIFDFEMDQVSSPFMENGKRIEGYHRQWEVIKNTIRTACGRIKHRFYARDCEIREVKNTEMRQFLERNCFYGYRSANVALGLYLKKDKGGYKKGTLMFLYSFGSNFYGNKKHQEDPKVEVIRASTLIGCQVIGGISKCIKHFCYEYPILTVAGKKVGVDKIIFYVDASHNDSRGMVNSNSSFKFVSWKGGGFMNIFTEDVDQDGLKGVKGEVFMRRPIFHKQIMKAIGEKKIVSVGNAGTIVFEMSRDQFLRDEGREDLIIEKPKIIYIPRHKDTDEEPSDLELASSGITSGSTDIFAEEDKPRKKKKAKKEDRFAFDIEEVQRLLSEIRAMRKMKHRDEGMRRAISSIRRSSFRLRNGKPMRIGC